MKLVAVFLLFFVGGPLVFWALTRAAPSRRGLFGLGSFVAVFALAGFVVRYGLAAQVGQQFQITAISVLMMWFAWIGALAFGAQALRHADTGSAMRRWTGVIGALGTTVPWFGLASARLIGA